MKASTMTEKIIAIREFENEGSEGYIIKTTEQEITFSIDNCQQCCESFGYMTSDDDLQDFIGRELRGIAVVDEDYARFDLEDFWLDAGGVVFIEVQTDIGSFQVALYNSHNGYYGHTVSISSNQLTDTYGV